MMSKFSAYLSLYEDWDLLRPSLESMAPFIDELVVVDGAYAWMAGFLRAIGKNPACSGPRVYDQLAGLGVSLRVISGIWASEEEKRIAGYEACAHRYVYRVDADEIVFLNPEAVSRFIESGQPVAEMEIPPFFHTPEWMEAQNLSGPVPRVGFLFDRDQISGAQHLGYLWIVARDVSLETPTRPPPSREAVAFTVHMTLWRSTDGARNRAAFYILNYFRLHGCNWLPEFENQPITNLGDFFSKIDPRAFNDMLLTTGLCISDFQIGNNLLCQSPLTEPQRAKIMPFYNRFLASQMANNIRLCSAFQYMQQGAFACIDITTDNALATIETNGSALVETRLQPIAANANLHCLSDVAPWEHSIKLQCDITPNGLTITLPSEIREQEFLRRILRFQVWTNEADRMQEFRCIPPSAQ
jgi:hypothetical protein